MAEKTKLEAALDELLQGKTTAEIVAPEGLLKEFAYSDHVNQDSGKY